MVVGVVVGVVVVVVVVVSSSSSGQGGSSVPLVCTGVGQASTNFFAPQMLKSLSQRLTFVRSPLSSTPVTLLLHLEEPSHHPPADGLSDLHSSRSPISQRLLLKSPSTPPPFRGITAAEPFTFPREGRRSEQPPPRLRTSKRRLC